MLALFLRLLEPGREALARAVPQLDHVSEAARLMQQLRRSSAAALAARADMNIKMRLPNLLFEVPQNLYIGNAASLACSSRGGINLMQSRVASRHGGWLPVP